MSGRTLIIIGTVVFIQFLDVKSNCLVPNAKFQLKKEHLNKRLSNHTLYEFNVSGLHECARACYTISPCESIDYYRPDGSCKLNDVNSAGAVLDNKDFSIFSDISEWPAAIVGSCATRPCGAYQKCWDASEGFICLDIPTD